VTRRRLVPDAEIRRVLNIAQAYGLTIGGLDVGSDHVRIIPLNGENDSLAAYIGPAHSQKAARGR
jgi:hypothetical protein